MSSNESERRIATVREEWEKSVESLRVVHDRSPWRAAMGKWESSVSAAMGGECGGGGDGRGGGMAGEAVRGPMGLKSLGGVRGGLACSSRHSSNRCGDMILTVGVE